MRTLARLTAFESWNLFFLNAKLNLRDLPQWQLFRDYKAITANATDDELRTFIETKAIPQCGLCPSNRTKLVHPNPLQRSALI